MSLAPKGQFAFETRFSLIFDVFGGVRLIVAIFIIFDGIFVPFFPTKSTKRRPNFMKNGTKMKQKGPKKRYCELPYCSGAGVSNNNKPTVRPPN